MKKNILLVIILSISITKLYAQDTLLIQENETGFCFVDGVVYKSGTTGVTGSTGYGYADCDPGTGKSISWQISVFTDGDYSFVWRYAFAGNKTPLRDAKLVINGITVKDTVYFPYTDTSGLLKWSSWQFSAPTTLQLSAGDYNIRLDAHYSSGLGNYDYLMVIGDSVTAESCAPWYKISVKSNDTTWGTVSCLPVQNYYKVGTPITIEAYAKPGYFIESWTGGKTSNNAVFTFEADGNADIIARFLPVGTTMDTNIIGYATVQDDCGTTYLVTGGALGDVIEAATITDLKIYLGDSNPHVVKFSAEFIGPDTITVKSNKTLLGVGTGAHLRNIELRINGARNVIIKNIAISHVTPKDAVGINGESKNIVIDHCEFYSDRDHGKDYYDGLLDIKNKSSFITVSWSSFHDHWKVCLMASNGDLAAVDSVARVTFHHNYFYNCTSRLPLIRFGKAHIFNNYYKDCDDAINTRDECLGTSRKKLF